MRAPTSSAGDPIRLRPPRPPRWGVTLPSPPSYPPHPSRARITRGEGGSTHIAPRACARGAYSSSHIDDSRLTRARGSGRRHSCRPPPLRGGDDDHRRGRTPRRVVARGRRQLGRGWWVADHVPGARLARPGADRGERDQHGVAVARLGLCERGGAWRVWLVPAPDRTRGCAYHWL